VPPDGLVAAVEPFDFTEIVNRATPYLENLQKLLNNTVALTEVLKEPQGDFRQLLASLKDLSQKINKGQGSLGLLVNDPALYREAVKTVGNIGKLTDSLGKSEGLLGTLIHDKAFSAEAKKTLGEMRTLLSNLQRSTVPVEEAAARLPELVKKAEAFLTNLERASAGLPDLVVTGQTAVGDVEQVAEAAKKSWLLRPYVPKPEERTIRVEKDIR
jgi:phospholipid/cholesterol/gamma-HCH transport system substrate-binding protein